MEDKILKDIRFYESDWPNVAFQSLPSHVGKIFDFNDSELTGIGQRVARKLNELKFKSGAFDHIYINLTTRLKENEIEISNRKVEKRIQYVNFGLERSRLNKLSRDNKIKLAYEITFKCLRHMYASDSQNMSLLNIAEKEISEYGSEIQIKYKTKKTRGYSIEIYYQIRPNDKNSCCVIYYTDNHGHNFIHKFDLQFYEDIYPLIDKITFKDDIIVLEPKKSFRASLYNSRYDVPIRIQIKN